MLKAQVFKAWTQHQGPDHECEWHRNIFCHGGLVSQEQVFMEKLWSQSCSVSEVTLDSKSEEQWSLQHKSGPGDRGTGAHRVAIVLGPMRAQAKERWEISPS